MTTRTTLLLIAIAVALPGAVWADTTLEVDPTSTFISELGLTSTSSKDPQSTTDTFRGDVCLLGLELTNTTPVAKTVNVKTVLDPSRTTEVAVRIEAGDSYNLLDSSSASATKLFVNGDPQQPLVVGAVFGNAGDEGCIDAEVELNQRKTMQDLKNLNRPVKNQRKTMQELKRLYVRTFDKDGVVAHEFELSEASIKSVDVTSDGLIQTTTNSIVPVAMDKGLCVCDLAEMIGYQP